MSNPDLTEADVIGIGGWHSEHAVVLVVASDGDVAVALVAGNGLGYEMEVEVYGRPGGEWSPWLSSGFGARAKGHATGSGPGYAYALGVVDGHLPGRVVLVAFGDDVEEVVSNDFGCWAWIKAVENPWLHGNVEVAER